METNMFDAIAYFTAITNENKLARQSGFIPVTVSGPQNLEGLFEEYRDNDRFVAISRIIQFRHRVEQTLLFISVDTVGIRL